jgi:hypothetical protein
MDNWPRILAKLARPTHVCSRVSKQQHWHRGDPVDGAAGDVRSNNGAYLGRRFSGGTSRLISAASSCFELKAYIYNFHSHGSGESKETGESDTSV